MNVKQVPHQKLNDTVFPSEDRTITAINTEDVYGGAHLYEIKNCLGFNDGKTQYDESAQVIQFVHKADDGVITPGLQNEQLYIVLVDRLKKLNKRFPDERNEKMIEHLEALLKLCADRVQERIDRGVMGDLKK